MLPNDCPYLKTIMDNLKEETSKKRARDESSDYDLTARFFSCIK